MAIRTIKSLMFVLNSDNQRYRNRGGVSVFFKNMLIPGFRFTFFLRICTYTITKSKLLYVPFSLILRHYKYKYGFEIYPTTEIGPGFYLGHFGGVVINKGANIGCNVNIANGVTIGSSNRGKKMGLPTIGNNVWIGSGAKVIGNIKIGDNSLIAPNAVVIDDVPDNCCVGGIPAKIISHTGANQEYIQNPIDINEYERRFIDKGVAL